MANRANFAVSQDFPDIGGLSISGSLQVPRIRLPATTTTSIVPQGFPRGVAYEETSKTIYYSNGEGWFPLQSNGAGSVIWRPLGERDNVTGTTWAEVMELIDSLPTSRRTIVLDPTSWIEASMTPAEAFTIPAGTYDLSNTVLLMNNGWLFFPLPGAGLPVIIEDGVKLNGLREISGPLAIEYRGMSTGIIPPAAGTTGACVDIDVDGASTSFQGIAFFLENNSSISCTGTAPFIEFNNSAGGLGTGAVVLEEGSAIVSAGAPVVNMLDSPSGSGVAVAAATIDSLSNYDTDTLSTLGVGGTSAVTTGGYKLAMEDPISFGGLPYVESSYFPSVDPGTTTPLRLSTATHQTSQPGPPVVGNDDTEGFVEGDTWIDSTGPAAHICLSNATGAAVWSGAIV